MEQSAQWLRAMIWEAAEMIAGLSPFENEPEMKPLLQLWRTQFVLQRECLAGITGDRGCARQLVI